MNAAEAAAHLAAHGAWRYSSPSGPGGQRRDHVATRAELVIGPEALAALPAPVSARLGPALGLDRRPLRLRAGTERSRERNRALVEGRLRARVEAALAPPPPPRRATAPGPAARERRLRAKAHRGALKRSRAAPPPEG